MPGEMDWVVHFRVDDNIDQVFRKLQSRTANIGTSGAAGGQFAQAAQAAGNRVREIGTQQGLPASEIARGLGSIRDLVRDVYKTSGSNFRRGANTTGFAPSEDLKLPKGYNLQGIRETQERIKDTVKGAQQQAATLSGLVNNTDYRTAQKDSAVAQARMTAALQSGLAGDKNYRTATFDAAKAKQRIATNLQADLAGDGPYKKAKADEAIARSRVAADVQTDLAGSIFYRANQRRVAIANQRLAAAVQTGLANDPQGRYVKATKDLAVARQRIAADVQSGLAGDKDYKNATQKLGTARARIAAETGAGIQRALAADGDYKNHTAQAAKARQRITADVQGQLAGSGKYKKSLADEQIARARIAADVQKDINNSGSYRGSQRSLALSQQRLAASVQEGLANDPTGRYVAATGRLAIARQRVAADVASDLAGSKDYRNASTKLAFNQQRLSAQVGANTQQALAANTEYKTATATAAKARQQVTADVQGQLAGSTKYKDAVAAESVARARIAADVKTTLADSPVYRRHQKDAAIAQQRLAASLQENLANDPTGQYSAATQRLAVARQKQAADLAANLFQDPGYKDATVKVGVSRARMQAETGAQTQGALSRDTDYLAATAATTRYRAQQQAAIQGALAGDTKYTEATVASTISRRRQQADVQAGLAADPEYKRATVDAARARELIKAKTAEGLLGDDQYKEFTKRAAIAKAEMQAQTQSALAADPQYVSATVRATAAKEEMAAKLRTGLASDQQYISATARLALAREEQAARVQLERAPLAADPNRQMLLARASQAQRIEADQQAIVNARLTASGDQQGIKIAAERRFAEQRVATLIRQQEREMVKQSIRSGTSGGSGYQKLQAWASPSGKSPLEFPTLGQTATQKTITTGGYALGGLVTGAALYGTIEAIKSASELQERFAGLKGQMEALGAGRQFVAIRDDIKGISNETGKAATEISAFYSRVLGITESPAAAIRETESAMKLMTVSGVDMGTMIEEVVPITKAFGISMAELGDIAVGIRDKFGVAEESTLHFLGETSSVMKEAGFSASEAAVIGAASANAVGKSAAVVGEQFSKVLGTINQNQEKIVNVYRRDPGTAALADPIIEAFSTGDTAAAFKLMLSSYDQLDRVQQDNLIRVTGSRREWALLNGLFGNSSKLLNDINDASLLAGQGGDVLNKRFEDVSATLNRTLERIKQLFTNLVEGIVSSGIGTALNAIGTGLELVLNMGNGVVAVFNRLNEATKFGPFDDGLLMLLAQITAGVFVAVKAWGLFTAIKGRGAQIDNILKLSEQQLAAAQGGVTATSATQTEAIAANTAAKGANVTATEGAAAANATAGVGGVAGATTSAGGIILPAGAAAASTAAASKAAATAAANATTAAVAGSAEVASLATTAAATGAGAAGVGITGKLASKGFPGLAGLLGKAVPDAAATGAGGVFAASKGLLGTQMMGAGASGVATAAGLAGIAATIYGSLSMSRSNVLEGGILAGGPGLLKGEEDAKARVKQMTTKEVTAMAEDNRAVWERSLDRVQEAFFDVDLPQTIYEKEANVRTGAKGANSIQMLEKQGALSDFTGKIKDENLSMIDNFLKGGGDETHALAKELGFGEGDNIKVTREQLAAKLPDIRKKAQEGDQASAKLAEFIQSIIDNQGGMDEIRAKIAQAVNGGSKEDVANAIKLAGGMEQFLAMQYDPKGALESGQITPGQYLSQLQANIDLAKRTIEGQPDQEAAYKKLNAMLREAQQYQDKLLLAEVARITRLAGYSSNRPKQVEYQALLARVPKMSLPGQLEQLGPLQDKAQAAFEEGLADIQDPEQLYNATVGGYKQDPITRSLDLQTQVRNTGVASDVFTKIGSHLSMPLDKAIQVYVDFAQKNGISLAEAVRQDTQHRRDLWASLGYDTSADDAILAAIDAGALDNLESADQITGDPKKAEKARIQSRLKTREANIALQKATGPQGRRAEARLNIASANARLDALLQQQANGTGGADIASDIEAAQAGVAEAERASAEVALDTREAMMGWAKVFANGDPIAETAAEIDILTYRAQRIFDRTGGDVEDPDYIAALQAIEGAKQKQVQNYANAAIAAFELTAFDRNRDPMQAAKDQAQVALMKLQQAQGPEARDQALLAMKQANRAIQDQIESEAQSTAQFAITMANVRQDPVEAARLAVVEAQRQLQRAKSLQLGPQEIERLSGELAQKQADAVDASVQSSTSLIDFMLEMGQITQSQAIERLKVERDKYEYMSTKWRDVQSKINSLEKSATGDNAYNLPANITLPTLYEARRLNQSRMGGFGYLDNRQVTMTVNVNGAQNPEAITNQVVGALQSAMGGGQVYSPGTSVGAFN